MDILEFSEKIINGVGGLHDFEHYEMASPKYDRDVSVAIWVIKCLANPKCEGSDVAVQAILERRNKLAAEQNMHLTAGTHRQKGGSKRKTVTAKSAGSPSRK